MITAQMIQDFRKDFAQAVKGLEQKYGVIIELNKVKYASSYFEGKILVSEGEDKDDVRQQEFNRYCGLFGLKPEDFDRRITITDRGTTEDYIIIGIKINKRKYPITLQKVSDGAEWNFTAYSVKKALGRI